MELAPGDRVDRYVLRTRLGEGGQGEVWRADDPIDAEHPKALKLVGVASASANQLERLRREARRLVQLKHPSLIACHGLFEDLHRDLLGVVMEYADGQSLDDAMVDARMVEDKRMLVLAHVAGVLAYVHQRNVVHRDIKLENVVVTHAFWDAPPDPATVKLIDFGIAVESDNPKPLTQLGCVIGTPPYLAPELIDPSGWNHLGGATPTSDVFAFGVLAWKLLIGPSAHPSGLPARSNMGEYAVAYRASAGGPWPPVAPQAAWVPVIAHCLALDPRDRVKDGLELVSELAKATPGVVLPTAEQAAPTPIAGEMRPATAPPTVYVGGAAPHTETAVAPAPLRASTEQPSMRTVPQAPDFARWSPRPQYTSEPVVQPTPQPLPQYGAPRQKRKGLGLLLGALFVLGSAVIALAVWAASLEGLLPDSGKSASAPTATPAVAPSPKPAGDASHGESVAPSPPPEEPQSSLPPKCPADASLCDCCPSGRDCGDGGCSAPLEEGESWQLRLSWISIGKRPRQERRPEVKVCVTRLRDNVSQCFSNGAAMRHGLMQPLDVTYDDIMRKGLAIRVETPGLIWPTTLGYKSHAAYPGLTRIALCKGLLFGGFKGQVDKVAFYLDDPDNPPTDRCSASEGMQPAPSTTTNAPVGTAPAVMAGTAQAIDPSAAAPLQPVLTGLARSQTVPGSRPVDSTVAGSFQQGQRLTSRIRLLPGKCYTVVAAGLPPVSEVNLQFVAVTPLPGMTPVLSSDNDSGPQAVLGKKPNCYKDPAPFVFPVEVVLTVAGGHGIAAEQVYQK